nr:DUF4998 domain-containing protein [Proteiniphilum sp. UBA4988]
MKNYILVLISILMITSCNSYLDKHQVYLEDGETVYLQKVDSVSICPGNKRAEFKLFYSNGNKLNHTILYWNNGANSITFDCEGLKAGKDSLIIIHEMEEGNYSFEIVNVNKYDQRSLKVPAFSSIYGDVYASGLTNRVIKKVSKINQDQGVKIEWHVPPSNYNKLEVKYISPEDNSVKIVTVENSDNVVINEIPKGKVIKYRTFYKPEELAIDLFPAEWSNDIVIP